MKTLSSVLFLIACCVVPLHAQQQCQQVCQQPFQTIDVHDVGDGGDQFKDTSGDFAVEMSTTDVWKPTFELATPGNMHGDKITWNKQPQPKELWIFDRAPNEYRWMQRGDNYPPPEHWAASHKKHVKVGKTVDIRFTLDIEHLELLNHADWCMFFQFHGKNGPEDQSVGQINISMRQDQRANTIPDGWSWALGVHGDNKLVTKNGQWVNKRYAYIPFDKEDLPCTWYIRVKCGGDGSTPAEDGTVYDVGETVFYRQTAGMSQPVQVWYVQGANYFPFQGYPDAGLQTPQFGLYVGRGEVAKRQKVHMENIAVKYHDFYSPAPIFNFNDVPGKPSDPIKQGLGTGAEPAKTGN